MSKKESSSLTAKRITWAGDDLIAIVYIPDSKCETLNLALGTTAGAGFGIQMLLDVDASKKDLGILYQYPALVQLLGGDLVIAFSWHTSNTRSCTRVLKGCQTIGVVRMNPDTISRP